MFKTTDQRQKALQAIDGSTLTPLIRKVLVNESSEVIDWEYRILQQVEEGRQSGRIGHIQNEPYKGPLAQAIDDVCRAFDESERVSGPRRGVFRFTGHARLDTEVVPWSIILKIQRDRNQRELQAYQSGLLTDLPGNIEMPLCYQVDEKSEGDYWLWLEDVKEDTEVPWTITRFGLAARHLAHFNGAYLTGRTLPNEPWLNRKPTRNWDSTAGIMAQLESVRDHPLIARAYSRDVAEGVRCLWKDRNKFLTALDELPRTLCHLDAQRSNLLSRKANGIDRTVAIDWGAVGIGVLGIEIAQLSVNFRSVRDVDLSQLQELSDIVYGEYLAGLQETGWKGDPLVLRLGYVASAALQNGLSDIWPLRGAVDPRRYNRMRLLWGERSVEENMDRRGELLRFILKLGDEARDLMRSV
jgi:hypothetical protein